MTNRLWISLCAFALLWTAHINAETPASTTKGSSNATSPVKKAPAKKNSPKKASKIKPHKCTNGKNPLCKAILELNPNLTKSYAFEISNSFHRIARKRKLEPYLLVAIAKQESNFKLHAVRMVEGLTVNEEGLYEKSKVGSDFCMMQINAVNIRKMKLDANRLITEADYCIDAGAQILLEARRYVKKEKDWWSRYNAVSSLHRQIYQGHILKHWRRLDPRVDETLCQTKLVQD